MHPLIITYFILKAIINQMYNGAHPNQATMTPEPSQ
jgi:hypothetical protein